MDFESLLRLFPDARPTSNGRYTCKCPAHNDHSPSMGILQGDVRAILKCFAPGHNCTEESICQAVGIKKSDLFYEPAKKTGSRKKDDRGDLVKVWHYKDENGKEVLKVNRYEKKLPDGKVKKAFSQHAYCPNDPNAGSDGYLRGCPSSISNGVLYKRPEIEQAKIDGSTVFYCEGEKCADALAGMGLLGTTHVGGAGNGSQKKWTEKHAEALRGAHVVVLPDNDIPDNNFIGQEHAWHVAQSLDGVAASVKLVNLLDICPMLKEKGDIYDVVEMLGRTKAKERLLDLVKRSPIFDPQMDKWWMPKVEMPAAQYFDDIPGYGVNNGRIVQINAEHNSIKPLANFTAVPRYIVTRDDGVETTTEINVDGWDVDGHPLPNVQISSERFSAMGWVSQLWAMRATVYPGSTVKDKLRFILEEVGRKHAEYRTEYAHTGWRQINGKWCYLYAGGAIGADGVSVDLGMKLNRYFMRDDSDEYLTLDPVTACRWSKRVRDHVVPQLGVPVIAAMYLAPLRHWMELAGCSPAFSLFVRAESQTGKSSYLTLALSHFGQHDYHQAPTSFKDTQNYILSQAFSLKDMPLLVDDFHPIGSRKERDAMNATADALSRAISDGADRGRLDANMKGRASKRARCLAIVGGEDLPDISASGMARYYLINLSRGDIPLDNRMTELQEAAMGGALRRCMTLYIEWLMKQTDELPKMLSQQFHANRDKAREMLTGNAKGRSVDSVATLMVGYNMMLLFFRDMGLMSQADCVNDSELAWSIVCMNADEQNQQAASEAPARTFVTMLSDMLVCGDASVVNITDAADEKKQGEKMVGYVDSQFYYFTPDVTYARVLAMMEKAKATMMPSRLVLQQHMYEAGMLKTDRSGNKSVGKCVNGKTKRFWKMPRIIIDGDRKDVDFQTSVFEKTNEEVPFK